MRHIAHHGVSRHDGTHWIRNDKSLEIKLIDARSTDLSGRSSHSFRTRRRRNSRKPPTENAAIGGSLDSLSFTASGVAALLLKSPLNIWDEHLLSPACPRCAALVSMRPQKGKRILPAVEASVRPSVLSVGRPDRRSSLATGGGGGRKLPVEIFLSPTFRTLSPARIHFSTLS